MNRSLFALAIGTFALGITEFGMMGILGDVARGIDVDIVKAGHLISTYSLGVAIGAPLLILLRRVPLKRLMMLLSAFIFIGNAATAIAPGYDTLLVARVIAGLPHGAFFGAGAIVCSRIARPGHGAAAVAVMVGGMTVANVIGVPAATFLSNIAGWRFAFAIVAFFGLLSFLFIRLWMPRLASLPDTGIKGQFKFLSRPEPWLIYAGVFFGQASVYCYLSYIEPVMTGVTGFSTASMTWIMMLAGAGMVIGNMAAGKLADRYGVSIVTCGICTVLIAVMPAIYFCAPDKAISLILMFVATACLFGIGGPLQYLIVRYARGGEMLGGAGIQIAFNVSNAMSAAIGGVAISLTGHVAAPALVGIPFALIGAIALLCLYYKTRA